MHYVPSMQAMPLWLDHVESYIIAREDLLVNYASIFHIEIRLQAFSLRITVCRYFIACISSSLHNYLAKPSLLTCALRLVPLFY